MVDKPLNPDKVLRVANVLKQFDLEEKEIALATLTNILTIFVEFEPNEFIAVHHQENGQPGFTVSSSAAGLQLYISRPAVDPDPTVE